MNSIYEGFGEAAEYVLKHTVSEIEKYNNSVYVNTGHHIYEHLSYRIKTEESMLAKCKRKGFEPNAYSALYRINDAVGVRIVTRFVNDVFSLVEYFRASPDFEIVREKDYINNPKPNGYRSYHLILIVKAPFEDVNGNNPGSFYVEVQLRTIAMDMWASLEHEMKYKQTVPNKAVVESELKRCADELASCDITMQTIKDLIRTEDI